MRKLFGYIFMPANAPTINARSVRVELRDVSRLDASSQIVAEMSLVNVSIAAFKHISFLIKADASPNNTSLSLRAHVDIRGDGIVSRGDFVTTIAYPVPATGDFGPIELKVQIV